MWRLCTPCGGGKEMRQAKQIAKRAMKCLMASIGETSVAETLVTEEYVDCCLGPPLLVINILQKVTGVWVLAVLLP